MKVVAKWVNVGAGQELFWLPQTCPENLIFGLVPKPFRGLGMVWSRDTSTLCYTGLKPVYLVRDMLAREGGEAYRSDKT